MSTIATIIKLDSYARTNDYISFKNLFYNPTSPTCKPTMDAKKLVEQFLVAAVDTNSVDIVNFLVTLLDNLKIVVSLNLILRAVNSYNEFDGIAILDRLIRYCSSRDDVEQIAKLIFQQRKYFLLVYLLKTNSFFREKLEYSDLDQYTGEFLADLQKKDTVIDCTILIHIFRRTERWSWIYSRALKQLSDNFDRLGAWMIEPIKFIVNKCWKGNGNHLVLIDRVTKDYFTSARCIFEEEVFTDSNHSIYVLGNMVNSVKHKIDPAKVMRFIKNVFSQFETDGKFVQWGNFIYRSLFKSSKLIFEPKAFEEALELVSMCVSLDTIFYYSWINPDIPILFNYPAILERVLYSHRNDPDVRLILSRTLMFFLKMEIKPRHIKIFELLLNGGADPSHKFMTSEISGHHYRYDDVEVCHLSLMYAKLFPPEMIELALEKANVNYFDDYFGMSLIRYVSQSPFPDRVKKLVELGAIVDDTDFNRATKLLIRYPNHPYRPRIEENIRSGAYSYSNLVPNRLYEPERFEISKYLVSLENVIPSLFSWSKVSITRNKVVIQKLPWVFHLIDNQS